VGVFSASEFPVKYGNKLNVKVYESQIVFVIFPKLETNYYCSNEHKYLSRAVAFGNKLFLEQNLIVKNDSPENFLFFIFSINLLKNAVAEDEIEILIRDTINFNSLPVSYSLHSRFRFNGSTVGVPFLNLSDHHVNTIDPLGILFPTTLPQYFNKCLKDTRNQLHLPY